LSGLALSVAAEGRGENPDVARARPCDDGGVAPPTVLIVDDHADFRTFARSLLEAAGFEVIGVAEDGASALAAARAAKPGLVLLDVQLPDVDGFGVCEQLALEEAPPVVVLTSSRSESMYRGRLAGSSARGFIAKAELSGPALAAFVDGA
jgi:CheY-like chemotaxis protein